MHERKNQATKKLKVILNQNKLFLRIRFLQKYNCDKKGVLKFCLSKKEFFSKQPCKKCKKMFLHLTHVLHDQLHKELTGQQIDAILKVAKTINGQQRKMPVTNVIILIFETLSVAEKISPAFFKLYFRKFIPNYALIDIKMKAYSS